jgi:hypothetical protein
LEEGPNNTIQVHCELEENGKNTFHALGGIQCFTPSTSVASGVIERIRKMPSAKEIVNRFDINVLDEEEHDIQISH